MQTQPATHDVVLVGAGHTNMHIVRMFKMKPIPGVRVTLISPTGSAPYSGMLPGTLAGIYTPEDMQVDLYRAVEPTGMQLIVAPATGLDPKARRVFLEGRPPVRFDVCSIGIGSVPAMRGLWAENENVLSIKPMVSFLDRLNTRLDALQKTQPLHVAIVGGGAAGTEIAFCLEAYLKSRGTTSQVSLIDGGAKILKSSIDRTRDLAMAEFQRRGIDVVTQHRVKDYVDGQLHFEDGSTRRADLVIWTAAAAPPAVLDSFDLPKTDDGFLAVNKTLQSTSNAPVFVVGDTASFVDQSVPKAGVYAVREGPFLWENIQRFLNNKPLQNYEPQTDFMSLLATGDGRAIGQYKGRAAIGKWVWKIKNHIDRKFMRMHQNYEPMMAAPPSTDEVPAMKCRGCGGKVGAGVLSAALEKINVNNSEHVGLAEPDDAAILDLTNGPANVVSVDFFQAFLSDPYIVGRVAALNALSDIWAMGADAVGALAMVTLPEASPGLQTETLHQLLAGGVHELNLAGAELLGGHTIESQDMTIGYTTLGRFADGVNPFRKNGVKPGDLLVLSKPLGTGTVLAALGDGKCHSRWMDSMLPHMLVSNQAASEVARDFGIVAATDVTGFGLAGHMLEMLGPSGCSTKLNGAAIPLFDGFAQLTAEGIRSTLYPSNRESAEFNGADVSNNDSAAAHALFDPQTSGGLLVAVTPARADELIAALRDRDCPMAAIIGEAVPANGKSSVTMV
ncbi:MAG: selenide, water dikinase SelD [Planctomycetaceae bacterium]